MRFLSVGRFWPILRVFILALLVLVALPSAVGARVNFVPARRDFICGRLARDLAAIDFDEDGNLDIACIRFSLFGPSSVTLLRGNGAGHFQRVADFPTAVGAASILAADFDEDQNVDLITAGFLASPATIGLHRGDGHGGFTFSTIPFPGQNPFQINGDDLNRDGHLDLVSGGTGDGLVRVLLGDGTGQFTHHRTLGGGGVPQHTAIGDINADGLLDLAVADNEGDVLLYFGDGEGDFAPARTLEVGESPVWIDIRAVGDADRPFLAVALRNSDEAEVFQWNPAASEVERVARLPASRSPISVALLTTAFGQSPGLAVVTQTSSELHLWRTLDGEPTILASQDSPTSVRIADWTQDGEPDFALPGFNTESISLFPGVGGVAAGAPSHELVGRPTVVRALNLNGDLRTDLAILRVLDQRITVLVAREPGVFDPLDIGESFPAQPSGMAVFDLGDDESPDFAAGNTFGQELWILRSSANYAREAIPLGGSGPSAIDAADLDHDGIEDLATSFFISDQVAVYFGVGPGGFAPPVIAEVGRGPIGLAIGDFDGNGLDDLATANNDETSLSVVTQGPARTLTSGPPIPFQVGFPGGLAAGHLDADEHLDLAVGGFFGLELFSGDGAGGFTSVRFIETAAEFAALRVADLDQDGIDELIAADRLGNALVILPGSTAADRAAGLTVDYPPLSFGVAHNPSDFEILGLDADGRLDLAAISSPGGTLTLLFTGGAELSGGAGGDEVVGIDLAARVASGGPHVRLTSNPFRERTAFLVDLARPAAADLRIYDVSGRLVAAPFAGRLTAGRSELVWEGRDARGGRAPQGIYFYRLDLGQRIVRGKLVRF